MIMTDIGAALLTLASIPPYSIGYGIGMIARGLAWVRACVVAGYRQGRGLA